MRRSIVSLVMLAACGAMAACPLRAAAAEPAKTFTADEVKALVAKLGDKDFKVRDGATKRLIEMGAAAAAILKAKAQEPGLDPEIAVRIKAVLEHSDESPPVQVNSVDFQTVAPVACALEDGKSVPVALKITNRGDKALQLNVYDTIAVHVKDAAGKELTINERRLRTAIPKPLPVEKGQSIAIGRDAELKQQDKAFRLTGSDGAGGTWWFDGLKAGKYAVYFTCESTQATVNDLKKFHAAFGPIADDPLFWIGKVTTKELTIEITDRPVSATRPAASQPADAGGSAHPALLDRHGAGTLSPFASTWRMGRWKPEY